MLGVLYLFVSILLAEWALAVPTVNTRSVSLTDFQNFNLFEQYSCAAYNSHNSNLNAIPPPGTAISCQPAECPLVHAASTTILTEFAIPDAVLADQAATGFVATDETNHLVVVSFRGTVTLSNDITDIEVDLYLVNQFCSNCRAHSGFWHAWLSVRSQVLAALKTSNLFPTHKLVVTGHSLGGAIATLAAAELRYLGYDAALYNYGSPMVGNQALATYISGQAGGNYRITHLHDIVPELPPPDFGFVHIQPEYWIATGNNIPVTTNDIQYLPLGRPTGDIYILTGSVDDHLWYFNNITKC